MWTAAQERDKSTCGGVDNGDEAFSLGLGTAHGRSLSLLTACAGEDSAETELTLVARNGSVGRATFTLFCEPGWGRPGSSCRL